MTRSHAMPIPSKITCAVLCHLAAFAMASWRPVVSFAQDPQTTVSTPIVNANDGFYEYVGSQWSVHGRGWFFNFGGGALPPFGGFDPNSGIQGGGSFQHGNFGGSFHFMAAQGNSRTLTSTTPEITMINGVPGAFFSGTQTPFVTQIVPTVADHRLPRGIATPKRFRMQGVRTANDPDTLALAGGDPPKVRETSSSGANRGDQSVAAIRKSQQQESDAQRDEALAHLAAGKERELRGEKGLALISYKRAFKLAGGPEKLAIAKKIRSLEAK